MQPPAVSGFFTPIKYFVFVKILFVLAEQLDNAIHELWARSLLWNGYNKLSYSGIRSITCEMEDIQLKHSTFKPSRLATLLCAGAMGFAVQAHAEQPAAPTPGYCSIGTASGGISTGDVTLNSAVSSDCFGVVGGNISTAEHLNDLSLAWSTNWDYLASTDAGSGTWQGLSFTVSAVAGSSGEWTLTGTDLDTANPPAFPVSMDLVVALKGSDRYALWGFNDISVNSGDNGGTFSIVFKNNGNQIPDLSHLTVFGRNADGGYVTAVPEAETYAMMLAGLGLVGLAAARRRRG